jgi:hypothetical protein
MVRNLYSKFFVIVAINATEKVARKITGWNLIKLRPVIAVALFVLLPQAHDCKRFKSLFK